MKTPSLKAGALLMLLLLQTASAQAAEIYSAPFKTSGTDASLGSLGPNWAVYYGPKAIPITTATANALIVHAPGLDSSDGYLRFNYSPNGSASGRYQYAVVNTDLNLSLSEGDEVSWNSVGNNSQTRTQLLIQSGGQWYVSNKVFTPINNSLDWSHSKKSIYVSTVTFSSDSSNWSAFTLEPNRDLSVTSPSTANLPSTKITGIGLFLTNVSTDSGTSNFIDNLTVTQK